MFIDPMGESKIGDEKLNAAKQKILNGNNMDGNGGLSQSWKLASPQYRESVEKTADFIRNFGTSIINRMVILVNRNAAVGAGHTEVMLINKENQAVLFGYFSKDGSPIGEGETRISVYRNSDEWSKLLNNKITNVVSNNGQLREEEFNDSFFIEINYTQGGNAFNEMASMFANPGMYNLFSNNCDIHTKNIVEAAGLFYDYTKTSPNESYNNTKIYYRNKNEWLRIKTNQMLRGY